MIATTRPRDGKSLGVTFGSKAKPWHQIAGQERRVDGGTDKVAGPGGSGPVKARKDARQRPAGCLIWQDRQVKVGEPVLRAIRRYRQRFDLGPQSRDNMVDQPLAAKEKQGLVGTPHAQAGTTRKDHAEYPHRIRLHAWLRPTGFCWHRVSDQGAVSFFWTSRMP
jgi:hypothetical protein